MSQVTKKVSSTREYTKVIELTCEICGAIAPDPNEDDLGKAWGKEEFDTASAKVQMKEGMSFPEGGSYVKTSYDVCPECFKKHIMPFIESLGGTATVTEHDW